ncbi:uncharacterized protein C2orf78-like [Erinaceus europaeus]|uniref:Uncharacterized protein C2orf78-like n=1 Tax=Erinaceus europaeus TaxID=9365 RepID=A0ABM3X2I7_ERIEU|nr:uncharacterized protein C2orf78-like [Erinaceus europaeus]
MCSLGSATQTSSPILSSSIISAVGASSPLTMSENFQNSTLLGTSNSLQFSLPIVSSAASLTASVCNFSRDSSPAVSSPWLLPSASNTSLQPLMPSAYLYQQPSTTTLPRGTGQSQISTSATSYPSILEWDVTGSTENKSSSLEDFTVTLIDQDKAVASMSMVAQYDKTPGAKNMITMYPSLSASLVQGTTYQIPNQAPSLALPYQEGNQVYYCNQGTLGPLLSGELGPCLQSYGSESYPENRGSVPQTLNNLYPEMVMVLKEVQPTNTLPPVSTSGMYYSVSTQPSTETGLQVMDPSLGMETSYGLQHPGQTLCLSQSPEFTKAGSSQIQILDRHSSPEVGEIPMLTPIQSSGNLALPPTQNLEQTQNKNLNEINIELAKSLDAYQIPIENEDPPLCPLEIPDIQQLLAYLDPLGQENQSGCENIGLGNNILCFNDQETLENGAKPSGGFADITTPVGEIHLPQLFYSFSDLDQAKDFNTFQVKDEGVIKFSEVQGESSVMKSLSDDVRNITHVASKPVDGPLKADTLQNSQESVLVGQVVLCNEEPNDRAPTDIEKLPNDKSQKAASSRISKTKNQGQKKTKENTKITDENKASGNKVKTEEKPTIAGMKRKKNQPDFSPEVFKKPRSCLGLHMLESVQVFHALGKKSDKKTGLSSSRALGNPSRPKDPQQLSTAVKAWLDAPGEGTALKAPSNAEEECSSPSQYELPPPGKVKLVPLPFPALDKSQARPVPRRPQPLSSHRPAVAYPARPESANSAQPTAVNPSCPTAAALTAPARPAQPVLNNPTRSAMTNPIRSSVSHSAASRPAPYKTSSCISLQRQSVPTTGTKRQSPPKSQNQFLIQDFCFQPIPWRKPNVPEPVMSTPITKEQRPEREAMKRKAQQERENAAKYTALGKMQYFIEREKEMEIARYYGYVK